MLAIMVLMSQTVFALEGNYYIRQGDYAIGQKLTIQNKSTAQAQVFRIKKSGSGYVIQNTASGKYMAVSKGSIVAKSKGTTFKLVKDGKKYRISYSGKYITADKLKKNAKLSMEKKGSRQLWSLVAVKTTTSTNNNVVTGSTAVSYMTPITNNTSNQTR